MNILISALHQFLISGGGETYIKEIAKKLQENGHIVTIATGRPFFNFKKLTTMNNFRIVWCRHFYLRNIAQRTYNFSKFIGSGLSRFMAFSYSFSFYYKLQSMIKDFDILLLNESSSLKYTLGFKRRKNIPIVAIFHGIPANRLKKLIKNVDSIIGIGANVAFMRKNFGVEPEIINPAVDVNKFTPFVNGDLIREKYAINENESLILSVGRLIPIKNIPALIKAMKILIDRNLSCKILIVGEGALRSNIERMISKLGLRKNIILTGNVPHAVLPEYYAASDIFSITSSFENYPIVILEAMASGKPVVATKVGGIPLLVKDSKNGFLVPSNDPRMLANAIKILLKNPDLRRKMGMEGRKMAESHPSWTDQALKIERLCRRLLNQT